MAHFFSHFSWLQLLTAFTGGTLRGFFTPISIGEIMADINWRVQWDFVFKKTIPLFWIPAQTLNFLLPAEFRILVAAIYSIILGVIPAIAAHKGKGQRA